MPLPEGYLPRKGDVVLIKARARRDAGGETATELYLEIVDHEHNKCFMEASEVHSLYSRYWNEGDRVREIGDSAMAGPVVAVFEDWVWVKVDKGESAGAMLTFSANEIEPEPEELEIMTEAELLAGLEPLIPPEVPGSQSIVGDDEEIKF